MPFITKGLHNRNRHLMKVSISTVYVHIYGIRVMVHTEETSNYFKEA